MTRSSQVYGAFAATAFIFAALVRTIEPAAFRPYFGQLDAIVVVAIAAGLGGLSVRHLESSGWLAGESSAKGLVLAAGAATGFGLAIASIDLVVVFPADANVALPSAVFFYPTMALIAEVVFHLLPLAAVSLAVARWKRRAPREIPTAVIVVVALLEPIFQVGAGFSEPTPLWANVYVGAHVFGINLVQLLLLRRHGFAAMVAMRLVYYLHWHLVWGSVRLELLF